MFAHKQLHNARRATVRALSSALALATIGAGSTARAQDILLTGVVRDFKPSFYVGGHPDFEQVDPTMVDKKYIAYLVEPVLGDDGKPVFNAGGWKAQTTGTTTRLLDVDFLDLFNGWAVGNSGLILRTDDAGKSWTLQVSGTSANLWAVDMIDEMRGWAVSETSELLATTDGGTTWYNRTPFPWPGGPLTDVQFLDVNNGFVVGTGGFFAKTADGGATWTTSVVPGSPTSNLQNVCFLNAGTGFVCGSGPTILWTTTGGGAWTAGVLPALAPTVVLYDIQFPTALVGYAVGTGGTILNSANAGANWVAQASGVPQQLNAVDFPVTALEGWAAGNVGRVLHTVDGGTTWTSVAVSAENLFDIAFPTDHYGFVAGRNGSLFRYDPPPIIVRSGWLGAGGKRISETNFMSHSTDAPALLGNSGVGSIDSPATFATWFQDQLGLNMSATLNINLVRQVDGTLFFSSRTQAPYVGIGGFFPIDNTLYGNPPWPYVPGAPNHNFNFTYESHAGFKYVKSTNPAVYVFSDDDVWLFIDGKLALAMAGVHWGQFRDLEVGRLRLQDGRTVPFDLFYAERQCCEAHFEIRVNFELTPYAPPTISNVFD